MLRNKTALISRIKKDANLKLLNNSSPASNFPTSLHQTPHSIPVHLVWYQEYYHNRQKLLQICQTSKQYYKLDQTTNHLIEYYQHNPSVYYLKQIEMGIMNSSKIINYVDNWLIHLYQSSGLQQPASAQFQDNLCKHFKSYIQEYIRELFRMKQRVGQVNLIVKEVSFSADQNGSLESVNGYQYRQQVFREVSGKIEHLQGMLRRMEGVVAEQGYLLNRIDYNVLQTKTNVKLGNNQLYARVKREYEYQWDSWSWKGRLNKVLICSYCINLILMLVLVLKNA